MPALRAHVCLAGLALLCANASCCHWQSVRLINETTTPVVVASASKEARLRDGGRVRWPMRPAPCTLSSGGVEFSYNLTEAVRDVPPSAWQEGPLRWPCLGGHSLLDLHLLPARPGLRTSDGTEVKLTEAVVHLKRLDWDQWTSSLEAVEVPRDRVYGKTKRYVGLPLRLLLHPLGGGESSAEPGVWIVQFECEDGYVKRLPLEEARAPGAYVAVRDLEAPQGADWVPLTKGDGSRVTPAPYLLVWNVRDPAEAERRPWPYQLVRLRLVRSAD